MKLKYTLLALLILLLPCLPGWAISSNSVKRITFDKYVEPMFPYALSFNGVVDGNVDIALDVNEDGTIADWLTLSSSHEQFTREIERVIDEWIFKPVIKDGVAIPIVLQIRFRFTLQGVVALTTGDMTNLYLNQLRRGSNHQRLVFNLSELDKIPAPVEVTQPMGVEGLNKEDAVGRVLIEFIIDSDGNVRLPVVRNIEGPIELAYSAYIAITSWKFEPPVRNGKAVAVRVRQPFVFSGSK